MFGFWAAGSAGNAASVGMLAEDEGDGWILEALLDVRREEIGADGVIHGVAPTRPGPDLFADAAGIAGKGLAATALPQLLCLLTADRDD